MKENKNYLFILYALIVTIIHNLEINGYIKDIIIPFVLLLILYLFMIKKSEYVNKKAFYLLIPIGLIVASGPNIAANNKVINAILLPTLYSIFFFRLTNPNYYLSFNGLFWIFKLFPNNFFSNLKFLKLKSDQEQGTHKNGKIIIGLCLGIIVGIIFIVLLASGDSYFDAFIKQLNVNIHIKRQDVILLVLSFIAAFSSFINIFRYKEHGIKETRILDIDSTAVISFLSVINFVFVLFLISEISKITNNFLQLPIKYTYAEYAREGFFQLLAISIANYIIISFLIYKSNLIKENKNVRILSILLIVFSLLLIGNSFYRLMLYISAYNFTTLRMQVILFLIMEAIIFIILIYKVFDRVNNEFVKIFIIMLIFYIINLYICTPYIASNMRFFLI